MPVADWEPSEYGMQGKDNMAAKVRAISLLPYVEPGFAMHHFDRRRS